jgi:mannosyltransferase
MRLSGPTWRWLLAGILVTAAINIWWGLGSSSLVLDEAWTWHAANAPIGELLHRVHVDEVAPPLYYVLLHGWISLAGSVSEAVLRAPSALAGVLVVLATAWLGKEAAGRRAALVAAGLAALSPLLLEYSQQARAYIFATLLATVAVVSVRKLERAGDRAARGRWLAAAVAAAVGALWFHYTATLVIAPLVLLTLARRRVPDLTAAMFAGLIGLGWLLTLPLMVDQLGRGHESGVAPAARLTFENLVQLLGTPFDGRAGGENLAASTAIGAVVLTGGALVVGLRRVADDGWLRGVLLPLAYVPVAVVVIVTLIGDDVMITRYTAVVAPVMIVVLAAGLMRLPVPWAVAGTAVAIAVAGWGSVASHLRSGQYPDVRGAVGVVAAKERPTDLVVSGGGLAFGPVIPYYMDRAGIQLELTADPNVAARSVRARRRIWIVGAPAVSVTAARAGAARTGYSLALHRDFAGIDRAQVLLVAPRRGR